MTLSSLQRTGIFILMQHLSERGMENVQQMRLVRSIRARMDVSSEDIEKAHRGVEFNLEPIDVDLTQSEVALIDRSVQWREQSLRQSNQSIPKWLAAVDEAINPAQHEQRTMLEDLNDPVSIVTNVGYALAGVAMVSVVQTVEVLLAALCFTVLGIGSTIGHVRRTDRAWTEDVQGMYLGFSALVGVAWSPHYGAAMAVAMTVGAVLVFAENWLNSFVVMPILVLSSIMALPLWPAAGVLLAFVVAVGIWQYSHRKERPLRDWGHGAWHVLTAAASVAIVVFAFA